MKMYKKGFTLIELIFTIVIISVLSVVLVQKYGGIINEAKFAQAKATISSVRSAIIMNRRANLLKGNPNYPAILDDATVGDEGEELFDGNSSIPMLQYPIYSKNKSGKWMKMATNADKNASYKYIVSDSEYVVFDYTTSDGKFDCNHTKTNCKKLIQ